MNFIWIIVPGVIGLISIGANIVTILQYFKEKSRRIEAEENTNIIGKEFQSIQKVDTILNQTNNYITQKNYTLSPDDVKYVVKELATAQLTTQSTIAITAVPIASNEARLRVLRASQPKLDASIKEREEKEKR